LTFTSGRWLRRRLLWMARQISSLVAVPACLWTRTEVSVAVIECHPLLAAFNPRNLRQNKICKSHSGLAFSIFNAFLASKIPKFKDKWHVRSHLSGAPAKLFSFWPPRVGKIDLGEGALSRCDLH
jgi:hypothetical protein